MRPNTEYRVSLVYANTPGSEGGEFELSFGDRVLKGRVAGHTGSWRTYRNLDLGTTTTGDEADVIVTMKAVQIPGEALTNIRRIVITPAPRG